MKALRYSRGTADVLPNRAANNYSNDPDGNTLTGGGRTNTWDSQNRLVNCVYGSNNSSYIYGADRFRHRSVVNGTTTDFALDGQFFVQEMRGGVQYATYLTGPTGPLYRRDATGAALRWYIYDGLGSVLGEVDASGNLDATRTYDVYGLARSVTGTPTSKHGWVGQLGHTSEDETGLVYMRARYMDPVVGRFVSEDPAKDGANWYCYADDTPTCGSDPSGRRRGVWYKIFVEMFTELTGNSAVAKGLAAYMDDKELENVASTLITSWQEQGVRLFGEDGGALSVEEVVGEARTRGLLGSVDSVTSYAEQNPIDFICIMLDIDGDFNDSNRVKNFGNSVGLT